jgi:hypothetical protein
MHHPFERNSAALALHAAPLNPTSPLQLPQPPKLQLAPMGLVYLILVIAFPLVFLSLFAFSAGGRHPPSVEARAMMSLLATIVVVGAVALMSLPKLTKRNKRFQGGTILVGRVLRSTATSHRRIRHRTVVSASRYEVGVNDAVHGTGHVLQVESHGMPATDQAIVAVLTSPQGNHLAAVWSGRAWVAAEPYRIV